ncbi:MAG: transporter [Verrucomicrobia bacterium]|nr:transporter [Verrucomicrobiota bacterium]
MKLHPTLHSCADLNGSRKLQSPCRSFSRLCAILCTPILLASFITVRADERVFTYSYEADSILPKGAMEFEQWITYKGGKEDGVFARWDIREEFEYGVTDRYTTALYLNLRNTHSDGVPGSSDLDRFQFKGISSENKYQLLSPYTDPIGLLLYGEITTDGKELELEEKLVLSKHFAEDWTAAFNLVLEEEWEFEADETEKELALELTAGLSYKLTQRWSVGLEALNVRKFHGFSFGDRESNAYFIGPNVHYGTEKWWATLTVLPQVAGSPDTGSGLNLDAHERVEVRLIASISF